MYIFLAIGAAISTSLTNALAKIGIKDVNSNFATLFRTIIVVIFSLILCFISGSIFDITKLDFKNWIYLIASGLSTGCSWLCYYKALKMANINKVAPIDKSSFILTSILFLIFFYNETTNDGNILTIIMLFLSMGFMLSGTLLMIGKGDNIDNKDKNNKLWLLYAILSAIFASLVSLFIKLGLKGINSDLGTFIRTVIVAIFSLLIVLFKKDYKGTKMISKKSYLFLFLSGLATGIAWLLEYSALAMNEANPVVVSSIEKFSILLTMLFSYFVLKEKFSKRSIFGLILLTIGIIIIVIFGL